MGFVRILVNGIPTTVNETTPGLFGSLGYQYVEENPTPTPPGGNTNDEDAGISPSDPSTGDSGANTNNSGSDTDVLPPEFTNLTLLNLGPDVWRSLVPALKQGTPEYEKAVNDISAAYYDVLQQQATAQTEQERTVAQENWRLLKDYIQQNLGVTLSNDAIQGWEQIQGLKTDYARAGIGGSGLEAEALDNYLKEVRRTGSVARTEAKSQKEAQDQAYYRGYATPEEIRDFANTNPEKAKAWGLVPSDSMKASMSYDTLKAKFPTLTDEQIQDYIESVFDEYGNYRSNLQQQHLFGKSFGVQSGAVDTAGITYDQYGNPVNIPITPGDVGIKDLEQAAKQYKVANAQAQNILDYFEANKDFIPTTAQDYFIRWAKDNNLPITDADIKGVDSIETLAKAINVILGKEAAKLKNIGQGSSQGTEEGGGPAGTGDTPPAGTDVTPPAGTGDTPPAGTGDTPPAGTDETPSQPRKVTIIYNDKPLEVWEPTPGFFGTQGYKYASSDSPDDKVAGVTPSHMMPGAPQVSGPYTPAPASQPPQQTTLTPEQQKAYFSSQSSSATPLSPLDWLKTQGTTPSSPSPDQTKAVTEAASKLGTSGGTTSSTPTPAPTGGTPAPTPTTPTPSIPQSTIDNIKRQIASGGYSSLTSGQKSTYNSNRSLF